MSDWDADSDDGAASTSKPVTNTASAAPIAPTTTAAPNYGRRKFDDEDVEDQIKDDWEEEEEEEKKADVSTLQPVKKKSTVKQKIKEREEEERRRAEMGGDESEEDFLEDPLERRRRERQAQIEADIANAANLLGTSKISQENGSDSLRSAKPDSKEDWEKFASDVYTAILKSQSTKPGYGKHFIPAFSKLLAENLRDVDCRKQSADWKKIGEDKVTAEKNKKLNPAAKKKAEKPKTVGTASAKNKIDTSAYGDEALGDDDLDFM